MRFPKIELAKFSFVLVALWDTAHAYLNPICLRNPGLLVLDLFNGFGRMVLPQE